MIRVKLFVFWESGTLSTSLFKQVHGGATAALAVLAVRSCLIQVTQTLSALRACAATQLGTLFSPHTAMFARLVCTG